MAEVYKLAEEHEKLFKHIVKEYMKKGDEILDAGCGDGNATEQILKLKSRIKAMLVDISEKNIEQAKKRLGRRAAYKTEDFLELGYKGDFDVVMCLNVVSETKDELEALGKLFEYTRTSGKVIFAVPIKRKSMIAGGIDAFMEFILVKSSGGKLCNYNTFDFWVNQLDKHGTILEMHKLKKLGERACALFVVEK